MVERIERTTTPCSKEADVADLRARLTDIERRCDVKEDRIRVIEAWQNKALGYALAFSMIASFAVNKLLEKI
jgi:hypothetical protein